MDDKKILRLFMMPLEFPCGEQSSCCGPIGQSEQDVKSLRSGIENELVYEVEIFNVKNEDDMKDHPQVAQLLHSLGPNALPIFTLSDKVVSIGNLTPEKAIAAIREKTEKEEVGKENTMIENENSGETGQEVSDNSQACCPSGSAGGDCCPPSSGSGKNWKMLVFILVVIAAGVVLARSVIRKSNSAAGQKQQSFAAIQPEVESVTPSPLAATANVETPAESKRSIENPSVVNAPTKAQVSDETAPSLWGKPLDSLASLSKVAAETDSVFILLAADDQQGNQTITNEIEAAAKKIQSNGIRISAFTLKKSAPNYAQLASQFPQPCVLAMVKGGGASGVSGEITEAKLIQAFVAASRPASACCPSGVPCGPTK
jgi:hypothetical protein